MSPGLFLLGLLAFAVGVDRVAVEDRRGEWAMLLGGALLAAAYLAKA